MSDYIKREDAIQQIWKPMVKPNAEIFDALKRAIQSEVENLPSADVVERKRGKWSLIRTIKTNSCPEHWLICSECEKYRVIKMGEAFPDYCENCGADMRGMK